MSSSYCEFEDYKTQIVKDFHAGRFKEVHERIDEMIKKFGHSWFTARHIFYTRYFTTTDINGFKALSPLAYNVVFVEKYPEAREDLLILPIACIEAHDKGQSTEALAMLKDRYSCLEKKLAESSEQKLLGSIVSHFADTIKNIENKLHEDSLEAERQLLEAARLEEIKKRARKRRIDEKRKDGRSGRQLLIPMMQKEDLLSVGTLSK